MYSAAVTRTRNSLKMGPLRVILRHFKAIQSYIYKVISNVKSINILSMIYAQSTTFSIKFILGKIKFPVFSLLLLLIFKFPVFSLILNKIVKFPDFSLQRILLSVSMFSLSVGTLMDIVRYSVNPDLLMCSACLQDCFFKIIIINVYMPTTTTTKLLGLISIRWYNHNVCVIHDGVLPGRPPWPDEVRNIIKTWCIVHEIIAVFSCDIKM